jgi:hypothetical protein
MNPSASSLRSLRGLPSAGWARRATAAVALGAVVLGASACGSSSPSAATTSSTTATGSTPTTSATGSTTATTTATPTTSATATLSKIEAGLSSSEGAAYVATYAVKSTESGKTSTVNLTIAHQGSNSLFAVAEPTGTFEELGLDGKDTICIKQAAKSMCYNGSLGAEFGASVNNYINNFGTKMWLAALKAASGGSDSSRTIDGQSDTCVTFNATTGTGSTTICVTSQGVLAEAVGTNAEGTYTMMITSFSASVPSNEFTLPATPTSLP